MSIFKFKHFDLKQANASMKVGTDAMLLGALIDARNSRLAIDVGAGTGVIALMVAQRYPTIRIEAVELDESSFAECKYNFTNSPWTDQLTVQQADFIRFDANNKYDLIFSNPPYYQTTLENQDRREAMAKHEKSLPMELFVEKMNELLSRAGEVWLIIPFEDTHQWLASFGEHAIYPRMKIAISGKRDATPKRMILRMSRKKMNCVKSQFTIRELNGRYSDEYKALTKEYHANVLP